MFITRRSSPSRPAVASRSCFSGECGRAGGGGRVGQGRNAFESTGQPGARVSGIGRRIPSKIRRRSETAGQARTGNGLLATAHQNDYTVRVSANSPRPAPPSCICRREWGSIRRRGQYSAICAAPGLRLIAVLWDAFIYCVPQSCRMPAGPGATSPAGCSRIRPEGGKEARCQGPMNAQGVWMRICHAQGASLASQPVRGDGTLMRGKRARSLDWPGSA